jgi:hypothetical protein
MHILILHDLRSLVTIWIECCWTKLELHFNIIAVPENLFADFKKNGELEIWRTLYTNLLEYKFVSLGYSSMTFRIILAP